MKRNLKNVFWLGGSPCAGKSFIGNILASRFDLDVYRVDEAFENHVQRLNSDVHATLVKWCAASWNERWMQPVENLVQEVIACYREHFTLVLDDVLALPKHKSWLVEGSALLPKEVARVLANRQQAVWVVPTADFQREHYAKCDWIAGIVEQCDDAESAFRNWMERDVQFACWIRSEAEALGYKVLVIDGQNTIEENALRIAVHFGLEVVS